MLGFIGLIIGADILSTIKIRKPVKYNRVSTKSEEFKIEVSFNPYSSTALILLRLQFVI